MAKDCSNGSLHGGDRESASVNLYVSLSPDDNTNSNISKISDHQHLESQRRSVEKKAEREGTLLRSDRLEDAISQVSDLSLPRSRFKTTFKMVIDKGDGTYFTRIAKLDTAADIDLISEDVVHSIGLHQKAYSGPCVRPIGLSSSIPPIGVVEFDWHVSGKTKTYTNQFVVLDRENSSEFDLLLSESTIEQLEFYQVNRKVWRLGVASAVG